MGFFFRLVSCKSPFQWPSPGFAGDLFYEPPAPMATLGAPSSDDVGPSFLQPGPLDNVRRLQRCDQGPFSLSARKKKRDNSPYNTTRGGLCPPQALRDGPRQVASTPILGSRPWAKCRAVVRGCRQLPDKAAA